MITVIKQRKPQILIDNEVEWTVNLLNCIKPYGNYSATPDSVKLPFVSKYQNTGIKAALKNDSFEKCVFCEGYIELIGYPHIEHFLPKSIYPKTTFMWSNLHLSCEKCNIVKGDTDTKKVKPILNPTNLHVESYFNYENLRIDVAATSPDPNISKNTIEVCDLQRTNLSREYAKILLGLIDTEKALKEAVARYNDLVALAAKIRKVNEIRNSVDNLLEQAKPNQNYAGFLRYHLRKSQVVIECFDILNRHHHDLSLSKLYGFAFD